MKRYKIKFKAQDEKRPADAKHIMGEQYHLYYYDRELWEPRHDEIKQKITDLVKKNYTFKSNSNGNIITNNQGRPVIMITYEHDGFVQMFWVLWDLIDVNKVFAYKTKIVNKYTPFYPEELRLLDMLDIPLYKNFADEVEQSVEDWF